MGRNNTFIIRIALMSAADQAEFVTEIHLQSV